MSEELEGSSVPSKRYFIFKCELFEGFRITASAQAIESVPFAASSSLSIRDGFTRVLASPFKTIFVMDEASGVAIFALTQNPELEAEAKKKKKKPDPPSPPVPVDPDCCASAGCGPRECVVTEIDCFCVTAPDDPGDIEMRRRAPFTLDDSLSAMSRILPRRSTQ